MLRAFRIAAGGGQLNQTLIEPSHLSDLSVSRKLSYPFILSVMINIAIKAFRKTTRRRGKFPKFLGNYATHYVECNINHYIPIGITNGQYGC